MLRSITHAVPGAVTELLRSAPLSQGKVQFAWHSVVGGTMHRATHVHLDGDLLIVDAASLEWARELSRSAGLIVKRLESLLGPGVVQRLKVRGPGSSNLNSEL